MNDTVRLSAHSPADSAGTPATFTHTHFSYKFATELICYVEFLDVFLPTRRSA